jgi:hypothetical protein
LVGRRITPVHSEKAPLGDMYVVTKRAAVRIDAKLSAWLYHAQHQPSFLNRIKDGFAPTALYQFSTFCH